MIDQLVSGTRAAWGLMVLAVLAAWSAGCQRDTASTSPARPAAKSTSLRENQDQLELAIDFVENYDEFTPREVLPRIRYHLSKWISNSQPDADWISDPLFGASPVG